MIKRENALLKLARGETPTAQDLPRTGNPLLEIAKGKTGVLPLPAPSPDVGLGGAFVSGLGRGIREPFQLVVGAAPPDLRIDTASEKTAEFLGTLAGMGVSFIPFAGGTSLALRGMGIVAGEAASEIAAYNFLRNTVAGAVQFAGTSESLEEVPENVALGVGFGAAIEGAFFLRAAGRGKALPKPAVDFTKEETAVQIRGLLGPGDISLENALLPSGNKTAERLVQEFAAIRNAGITTEEIVANLARQHENTLYFSNVADPEALSNYARRQLGSEVDILHRVNPRTGNNELLIHNPFDPTDRLTGAQTYQWRQTGYVDGLVVEYNGKPHLLRMGSEVQEGYVQLQNLTRPQLKYAVLPQDFTKPVVTTIWSESTTKLNAISQVANRLLTEVGFAVPTKSGRVLRGSATVSNFERASSFRRWLLGQGVTDMRNSQEAVEAAIARGVDGIIIEEAGIPLRYQFFNQRAIKYAEGQYPMVGVNPDKASIISRPGPAGEAIREIEWLEPSWQNSFMGVLRREGIPEKEVRNLLEIYRRQLINRTEALMDPEVRALVRANDARFAGGCM